MTARDGRALRRGCVVVAVAVVALRLLPWTVRTIRTAERDVDERATLLAHTRAELAQAGALGDSAAELTRALVALGPALVSGGTEADASADLANRLTLAAAEHAVRVTRLEPLPNPEVAGRLHAVTARLGIEGDIRGVSALVQVLGRGAPVLTVDAVRLLAADPAGLGPGPEVLQGDVTVQGWYLATTEGR